MLRYSVWLIFVLLNLHTIGNSGNPAPVIFILVQSGDVIAFTYPTQQFLNVEKQHVQTETLGLDAIVHCSKEQGIPYLGG